MPTPEAGGGPEAAGATGVAATGPLPRCGESPPPGETPPPPEGRARGDICDPDGNGAELNAAEALPIGRTGGRGRAEGSASRGPQTRSALWAAKVSRCMSSAHAAAEPAPWALATKWSESSSEGSSESVRQPPEPGAEGSLAPERKDAGRK